MKKYKFDDMNLPIDKRMHYWDVLSLSEKILILQSRLTECPESHPGMDKIFEEIQKNKKNEENC